MWEMVQHSDREITTLHRTLDCRSPWLDRSSGGVWERRVLCPDRTYVHHEGVEECDTVWKGQIVGGCGGGG
jgi:hypothetical protein